MSDLEPIDYETGTVIRDYDITNIKATSLGYEVQLDVNLDSGYSLSNTQMEITHEDLAGYETSDVEEAVKCALGFFEQQSLD